MPIGWREGLLWGLGGFAVFMLAPSLGLPPELPGMPAAELGPRQVWWLLTAAATAAGLALLAFRRDARLGGRRRSRSWWLRISSARRSRSTPRRLVPEALAHRFVVAVTVTNFLFWVALGVLSAVFFERFGRDTASRPLPDRRLGAMRA